MNIIGIDFGNDTCVVSTILKNRLDVILNDYHERKTPSMVAFTEKKRELGTAAYNQLVTNIDKTYFAIKHKLLAKTDDNIDEFCELSIETNDSVKQYNIMRVVAMLLSRLKDFAKKANPDFDSDCVIAYPSFFGRSEISSLCIAAQIAGLQCRYLVRETTAVAINYCFYKKIPKKINVIFVDFGHSSVQISAWTFYSNELKLVAEEFERIGGHDVDELLATHFIKLLNNPEYSKENKVFYHKLLREVEKVKKQVCLDTATMTLDLEFLMSDFSVILNLNQNDMNKICEPIFKKIHELMLKLLKRTSFTMKDIHSIEIVGGSCHIPMVGEIIQTVFGKLPRASMNQDEAVARGCMLRAILPRSRPNLQIVDSSEASSPIREHRNIYQSMYDELQIQESLVNEFSKRETIFKDRDEKETERYLAYNELYEFCARIRKREGAGNLSPSHRSDLFAWLNKLKFWHEGTISQYKQEMTKVENWILEIKRNKEGDKKGEEIKKQREPEKQRTEEEQKLKVLVDTINKMANEFMMKRKKKAIDYPCNLVPSETLTKLSLLRPEKKLLMDLLTRCEKQLIEKLKSGDLRVRDSDVLKCIDDALKLLRVLSC